MRFLPDPEQRAFTDSLDAMLTAADTPAVVRGWSRGDHTSGRALWSRLAGAGLFALAVPEPYDGLGLRPVELTLAFVELGRHAVPGPLVETVAAATLLAALDDQGPAKRLLPALASGESAATLSTGAYTLDADMADVRLVARPALSARPAFEDEAPSGPTGGQGAAPPGTAEATQLHLAPPPDTPPHSSLDPARRLFPTHHSPRGELLATAPPLTTALLLARLTTAAQALGVGLTLLDKTVAHVRQRTQFGAPIGSFQAVKHQLADVKIALEFARPLVLGAALTMTESDVAAAKLTACTAAYTAARTALQLHGAIGYTAEYDLSLWLTKARALRTAWGTPDACRSAVLSGDRRW
ncbi:acyl-CoA dehydrogenase [Streptomyces lincolnensis]|uniref:Acyl-CoA dehydrogenase n=1 Tax=Streptomyces lincolnensis TaxID=1915 RepID=A0A1B1M7G2_STRLN|nr:acyl-CoA dehydrogenase family protein [Streptomyces lincolnensis]ANS64575.1 acyl-CoA dehydrogenase [Streptomyces lincolnensis]AXG57218.1 acyl-CoA dehydrogenase [Streptomyces lincolnensis]QMV06396.1 acyl-CoA dehydrogenase [Streptomyces lincolnensis]